MSGKAKNTASATQKAEEAKKNNDQSQGIDKEKEFAINYEKYKELTKQEPPIEWDLEKLKEEVLKLQPGSSTEGSQEGEQNEEGSEDAKGTEEPGAGTLEGNEPEEGGEPEEEKQAKEKAEEAKKNAEAEKAEKANKAKDKAESKAKEKKLSPIEKKYSDILTKHGDDLLSGTHVCVYDNEKKDIFVIPSLVFTQNMKKDKQFTLYSNPLD